MGGEVDLRALLVDVRAVLRSNGLHDEADLVSQELEAALASRDAKSRASSYAHLSRAEDLNSRCELYDRCYEVLQPLCSSTPAVDGFAPLQQRLWCRSMEVSREWSDLHEQQRQELSSLGASYQHLKQEHQVLRSNLRSLKLTVQQLLTDVSTLLQHTASARQQQAQQQHQQPQQPQQQPTAPQSKQPGLQQQLLRAGLTTGTSHRGVHGGRRCASADGGVPSSAAASGGEGSSSMVAITMQRLIASIERMSRHFADCQAGKLIGDYSSSSSMGQQAGSGSSSSGTMPGGTATRANNSTTSMAAAAAAAVGPETGATSGQHVPRPPSSSSNSSSRPGVTSKVPGPPVLRGVAAAAAAISTAMANAAGQTSRQLLSQQQQQEQEQSHSTAVPQAPLPAAMQASADDGMRHSFDSTQARAAADAWFASKARATGNVVASADTAGTQSRHAAGPTDASSASLSSSRHSSDVGSTSRHHSRHDAPCQQRPGATSSSQGMGHKPQHMQLEQQQQQVPEEPGSQSEATAPEHGRLEQGGNGWAMQLASSSVRQQASQASDVAAAGAGKELQRPSGPSAAAVAQAASAQAASQGQVVGQPSSSSSSSLGCSQSEVWPAPHSRSAGHAANGRAVTSVPGLVTPWSVRQQQQQRQQEGPHTSLSQLQSGHRTTHPDRPSPPLTSSRPSGVWGGSIVWHAASRRRPVTAGGLLPSGPLTAALNSSTAHSSRHSRASNPHSPQHSREQQVPGGRGPTADMCSSWAASSSRSASSCSQRSAHSSSGRSSNSCVSTAPQHWPHGPAGGIVGAHSANSRGLRAALVSASSSSSLGSDAVLLGSFTTAASGSANNSPASKSVTSVLSSPAGATQDLAGSSGRARILQDEASTPHRVVTATASPDARRAGQSHQQQQQQAYSAAVPAGTGPPKAARALQWSDHPSKRQSDAAAEPTPAAAGPTAGHVSSSTAEQLKPAGSTPAGAAAPADAAPKGELSAVTGQQPASTEPAKAASKGSRQQGDSADEVPDSAVPAPVTELQSSLKVQPRQQLQLQPVLPCLLAGRVRIGLLSPILEEGIGSNGSTNTTPGTSAGSPAVAAPLQGAFSNGSCRSSSKLRSSSSEAPSVEAVGATAAQESVPASAAAVPAAQPQSDYAAAQEMPDAFKQGSRESSPKTSRVESPLDTAVGRDTAPCGSGGFAQQRRKQTGLHDQQEQKVPHDGSVEHPDTNMVQAAQDKQQQHLQRQHTRMQQLAGDCMERSAARSMSRSSPTFGAALDAAAGAGIRRPRSAHMCCRSWDGSGSSSDQPLAAFPVDLGPLSHSIESLDTLLMDTSCCFSEEDVCIDSLGSSSSRQGLQPPVGNAAAGTAGAEGAATAVCMLDLQDLLAIVLDVMNDKQTADKRYMATGLPQPTLGRHLQCYVAAKVHSDQPAYSSAMAAILTGLEQHKQVQPEIAVFCRVLSDELDEDYFHQRHLRIRQQLQQLATQAAMEGAPQQQQQQQSHMWENCCSMPLCESKLLLMLRAWAGQRGRLLHALQQPGDAEAVQQLVSSWERNIRMHCGCGPEQAVRAGSAVAALLLWELQQHLAHLKPIAAAFKAADARCQGVLGLAGFRVFCRHLNQAMSDEEVQLLFYEELRGKQHDQVTFTVICRVLLPAMWMPTQ